MAEEKDYLMSVDMFNNPATVSGDRAQALKIVRLILMNPGSDPLHPEMGVGLKQFRYSLNARKTDRTIFTTFKIEIWYKFYHYS